MSFVPDQQAATERRKVVIIDTGNNTVTVTATRTFLKPNGTADYKLEMSGTATTVDEALTAGSTFMRTGAF